MSDINPGPSIASNPNSVAVLTPVNTQTYGGNYQGSDGIRLLGQARGINANAVGDTPIPVINSTKWVVQAVLTANASTTAVTNAFFSVNAATNNGGTTIVTGVALAALNATTYVKYMTVIASNTIQTGSQMYVNIGTTLAGAAATFDAYIYGYDLS
jgi:hypothetical protein